MNIMKKISIILCLIFSIGIFSQSCEKEKNVKTESIASSPQKIQKSEPVTILLIQCQLHRKIEYRPRDHKFCGCVNCFGICDVEIAPWVKDLLRKLQIGKKYDVSDKDHSLVFVEISSNNKAKLYILEDRDYFEDEFGIDESIVLEADELYKAGFQSVTIESGEYKYKKCQEKVYYENGYYLSYGYVDINIQLKK